MSAGSAGTPAGELFPDLAGERAHLVHARRCRVEMIADFRRVLAGEAAADHVTQEYVQMTAEQALDDLADPATAEFFGRIDVTTGEVFHIGRRHIETADHDHVVVDWRAEIAAPFYRATVSDPLDIGLRRRFTLREHELVAYSDEHLDDPDAAEIAGGIPDPVLAEMGAARTGAMREIVATIQGEQDLVIRAPAGGAVVVQGGPGTGKTAVGLHRAAYLLFEQRRRLSREGVLVVGPNQVFLAYIADVLPSLGERSVEQRTLAELLVPKVDVTAIDSDAAAALKGDLRMAAVIERAARRRIEPPTETISIPVGTRTVRVTAATIAAWIERALDSAAPFEDRRRGLKVLARAEVERLAGTDAAWAGSAALRGALDRAWPALKPVALVEQLLRRTDRLAAAARGLLDPAEQAVVESVGGRRHRWSVADAVLVDEAKGLLDGPVRTYGHVVVDEAQDLTAMALRAIARRCPSRSLTVLGDLAQSTTPGGQRSWDDAAAALGAAHTTVANLSIGYRVPAEILTLANRLLDHAAIDVPASRSARPGGQPSLVVAAPGEVEQAAIDALLDARRRHRLSGIIAPGPRVDGLRSAARQVGLHGVDHLDHLADDEVPIIAAEASKGLELDAVVAVEPWTIAASGPRGARLAYIVLTRAVHELAVIATEPHTGPAAAPPARLAAGRQPTYRVELNRES